MPELAGAGTSAIHPLSERSDLGTQPLEESEWHPEVLAHRTRRKTSIPPGFRTVRTSSSWPRPHAAGKLTSSARMRSGSCSIPGRCERARARPRYSHA